MTSKETDAMWRTRTEQPEALRLADFLDMHWDKADMPEAKAAAELRRLHKEVEWMKHNMSTKLEKESVLAIQDWCKKQKMKLISKPRHVHSRAYVVGHAASSCLIVARCWADSEPQTKEWNKKYPLQIVHKFDESLKVGDWCITAYVSTVGSGEPVAIPIKEKNT